MDRKKPYYSVRTGKNPMTGSLDIDALRDLFKTHFKHFEDEGYFQEHLGFYCVDADFIAGKLGQDLEGALLLALRKRNLTPIILKIPEYKEDDLFDIIEFLYDYCSKPVERTWHGYNQCGWHCSTFHEKSGQAEFRTRMNKILELYEDGYELSEDGEILSIPEKGIKELLNAKLPELNPQNVNARVDAAQKKFRRYRSSYEDRRDAVRDLADVLEYLKPELRTVLNRKDESALFDIANNFGIRHHNADQKTDCDKSIWYSWIFYFYLSTIHAVVRLIKRSEGSS